MTYYRQCRLSKGTTRQVSWIPEEFAVEGDFVRLSAEDGWRVDKVGQARVTDNFVREHERDHLKHRSRTDI